MGLPTELRLRKHADYQRAYTGARKQHTKLMTYFVAERAKMPVRRLHPDEVELAGGARVGLTVPKALGKAHDRNRIKRRMRAAVRGHAAVLEGLAVDVILHPRKSVEAVEFSALEREVAGLFRLIRKQYGA